MKSYLSLIPISAKVHRRQNRMTLLCIVFAVFMVTAVFSMAEMGIRMEGSRLMEKHGNLSVGELLGSSMGQTLLPTAFVLSLMILLAGILMISGSMNSVVAQRTQFFGMMRCLGMSRRQVVRFVRLEALNWCKTAVPVGLALGVTVTWRLCAVLRFLVGEEFSNIPLFGISITGILCGILVGVITVLLAANAPAKRAARVSPAAAASGNAGGGKLVRHAACSRFGRIETALGMHHAASAKKNLILMTGSFALSIVLFLSFSVVIDFVNYLMPQSAAAADLEIAGEYGNTIPPDLPDRIRGMGGVREVYGRRSALDLPVSLEEGENPSGEKGEDFSDTADLISYDDFDLKSLKKDRSLIRGSDLSRVFGNSSFVLATSDEDSPWEIGDTVQLHGETLTIAGLLKNDPFSSDGRTHGRITLIASGDTFVRLTGEENYSLVMVQLTGGATEEEVQAIQTAAGEKVRFRDRRDESTAGTYMAFVFCIYAFLAIIALVAVLNIVNSISMSVSARIRQYGMMRAVGMGDRQVIRMIAAEAGTYAVLGGAAGCLLGIPAHWLLYGILIVGRFPYAVWKVPLIPLAVILLFLLLAAAAAVLAPAKRICGMAVTETISEL